jgi:hypothetical protein
MMTFEDRSTIHVHTLDSEAIAREQRQYIDVQAEPQRAARQADTNMTSRRRSLQGLAQRSKRACHHLWYRPEQRSGHKLSPVVL